MLDYSTGIEGTLPDELTEKVVLHKQRFKDLFKARYMEILPSLIKYQNSKTVSIDFLKVEIALRNGYDIAIGETFTPTGERNLQVIGWVKSQQTINHPGNLFSTQGLDASAIDFVIPMSQRQADYIEISHADECQTGNFVVLRNKNFNYVNDMTIIDHYVDELAEIVLSRFSISMQVKINTIFLGEHGDQTLNDMITDIYNGNPFIKATKLFDPNDQIVSIDNANLASNFKELKTEYQHKISELNNMLGLNSLAVEKESGVSDTEADSNRAYTTSNANIYLDARNHGLERLNKRYNLNLQAVYNDEVVSELQELQKKEEAASNESEGPSSGNDTV